MCEISGTENVSIPKRSNLGSSRLSSVRLRPLHVVVLSPYPLYDIGIRHILLQQPHRVTLLDHNETIAPDIALCDLAGLDAVAQSIRNLMGHGVAVLGVARATHPAWTTRARGLGVTHFIGEDLTSDSIHRAIELAAAEPGGPVISARPAHTLSEREKEILRLIATGLSNDAIARKLFLSINTVKTYIRTGYRKVGVRTRSEAVLWTIQHGLADAATPDMLREEPDHTLRLGVLEPHTRKYGDQV